MRHTNEVQAHSLALVNKIQQMRGVISQISTALGYIAQFMSPGCDYSLVKARRDVKGWADHAEIRYAEIDASPALVVAALDFKANTREMFAVRCRAALDTLAAIDATLAQREQEETAHAHTDTTEAQDITQMIADGVDVQVVIDRATPILKQGYTVRVAAVAHGSRQVEIRKNGDLRWRGWTFEDCFSFNFERYMIDAMHIPAQAQHTTDNTEETATMTRTAARIAELKESIALMIGDLRLCQTREQIQSINALITARKAELMELEETAQESQGVTQQPIIIEEEEEEEEETERTDAEIREYLREVSHGADDICVRFCGVNLDLWMDAEEVAQAGGPYEWVRDNADDLTPAELHRITNQDYEVVCDEGGIVGRFCSYGSGWGFCDWSGLAEALEVIAGSYYGEEVFLAGLECGIDVEHIEEAYQGEHRNHGDFAYQLWDDCGYLADVPDHLENYIDWEAVARDLMINDYQEENGHYFSRHW